MDTYEVSWTLLLCCFIAWSSHHLPLLLLRCLWRGTAQAGLAYPAKDMMKPELAEKLTARAQQREGIL